MNLTDAMPFDEAQIALLFEEAGMVDTPAMDMRRVDQVLERAVHESVIKDTTSFVFKGFPAVIAGMMSVATGCVGDKETDYKA